jgi:hypothetical protein
MNDDDQHRGFLAALFEPDDVIEFRIIHPGSQDAKSESWPTLATMNGTADGLAGYNARGWGIYFGANPRKSRGGTKSEHVAIARCHFVDLDGATVSDSFGRIEAAGLPMPTAIVSSGGGVHAWWRLTEPVTDLAAWTARQKGLARLLGGDSKCSDPARVMRLPGFVNTKPKYADRMPVCSVEAIDAALVYQLSDIATAIPPEPAIEPPLPRAVGRGETSSPDVARRAEAYIDTMQGAVSGQGGHDKTYAVAVALVHGFGLELEVAYDIMARRYNPRCDPPWSEKELWHKLRDAANKPHDRPYGWLRDAPRDGATAPPVQLDKFDTTTQPGAAATPASQARPWTPFPTDLLPSAVRDYVVQTADGMACDPSLVALPMLAGLAAAIGNTRTIALKDDWEEPSILWVAIVADSGSLKTPAAKKALRFITQQESEIERNNAAARDEHDRDLIVHEARLAAWKQEARRGNAGDPPAKPSKPAQTAYVVSDTTIEALVGILADNPRGVLLERDELAGWLAGFDKYKSGGAGRVSSEVGQWLEMHNAGRVRSHRKSTGLTFVERASVCITGGIQPGTLVQAVGQEHVANGLLARFLLAAPPRRPKRFTTITADFAAVESARRLFETLYGLSMPEDGPKPLRLSRDGLAAWETFFARHADRQLAATGIEASMLAKIEAAAARLALVHHVCRQAGGEVELPHAVDAQSVEVGVSLAEWFADEWLRVYESTVGGTPARDHDGELLAWIDAQGGEVAERDIGQRLRRYRDPDLLDRTITSLVHAGRLESFNVKHDRGGRPARWLRSVPNKPKPK